ncbi:hypothetical protein OAI87_00690 [Paracoccaceae bacterium]|nr:hypothetical protein [Paracoccaceae bacterium]
MTTSKLINFHIPIHLSNDLDSINRFKRVSRTSVINRLLEHYLRTETKKIKEDGKLNELLQSVKLKNPPIPRQSKNKTRTKSSWSNWITRDKNEPVVDNYEPPNIYSSVDEDDDDYWRKELMR